MEPPERTLWRRVPGYDSGDESEDDAEDSKLDPVVRERLALVTAALSQRDDGGGSGHQAVAAGGPSAFFDFSPAPMPPALAGGSTAANEEEEEEEEEQPEPGSAPQAAAGGLPPRLLQPYSQEPGFRIEHTDAPVVRDTLVSNGLSATPENWLVLWSGPRMPESTYQDLCEYQRVNHFPGSTELTRKDRLWLHFNDMAKLFGGAAFDFVPETFVLPDQLEGFIETYEKTDSLWIVKPTSSSRGRGIFLLRSLDELPFDELSVVSRYVHNPLLIQGLKFDLRVYVLVTSYEPLRAYIYREGLTRFACLPYSTEEDHLQDAFRHLTNYSINKDSSDFVENKDFEADNVGHKWSLSALNKHLKCVGVDVKLMWARIMDLVVKSLLSVEPVIAARTRQVASHPTNCFELYGFDVLVDSELKPWLLEVNLSPSMKADSPLDWQIKSALLRDVLNLVGVPRVDRQGLMRNRLESRMRRGQLAPGAGLRRPPAALGRKSTAGLFGGLSRERRSVSVPSMPSLAEAFATAPVPGGGEPQQRLVLDNLTDGELRALVVALQEHERCHNFIRLHPTRSTVERYAQISSLRGIVWKPGQAGRACSSRCSQLLAALLFGPPPMRSPLGAALDAATNSASLKCSSAPQIAPLRLETLAPLRPTELSRAGAGAAGVATDASQTKDLDDPLSLPVPVRKQDAWISPNSTDESASPGGRTRRPDTSDGHGLYRRALEVVKELGMREGCRVVLMEYLIRLAEACSYVPTLDATRMSQAVLSRLSAFHKRLSRSVRAASASKFLAAHHEREPSGSPYQMLTDGPVLMEELAAACKACLSCLQRDALAEPARSFPTFAATAPLPLVLGKEESQSQVARHLPSSLSQSTVGQRLLAILPRLSALDLERILADPRCDAEFRTLLDSTGADQGGHRQSSPYRRFRQSSHSSMCGRLEPRRVLWGPLSELLQSSQASLEPAAERPSTTQERRCRSSQSERSEDTPSTSFERLTGSWAKIAQRSDSSWQSLALPTAHSPKAVHAGGLPECVPEGQGRLRHRAVSDHLLEAVSGESPSHRLLARSKFSPSASVWARDIEL